MFIFVYLCIILKRKRKLVALLLLSYRCIVTISVLWVGLVCVIVAFPDQTHLLFIYMHKVCIQILKPFSARHKMAYADLRKYLKLSTFSSRTRFKYLVQSGLKVIKRFFAHLTEHAFKLKKKPLRFPFSKPLKYSSWKFIIYEQD